MNGSTSCTSSHHPSLEDEILSHLRRRSVSSAATRKEIQKELVTKEAAPSSSCDVSKKEIKKSLKRLVKRGDVVKDGKKYKIVKPSSSSSSAVDESGSDGDRRGNESSSSLDNDEKDNVHERDDDMPEEEEAMVAPIVPIAARLRQATQTARSSNDDGNPKNSEQKIDLDEEIRRLEAELAESNDDDDDGDEESDYDDDNSISDGDDSKDERNTTSQADGGVICLSSVADERIVPLPQAALPQNKRRTLKNIDSGEGEQRQSKKRKRSTSSTPKEEHVINEGLKDAVNELLSNYVPSSHLKKPFYCRVCQHQSTSESDFLSHKQSEFHKGAVQQEKKRTYCKLCRKQLTSIVQMEEHLKSRPHREKMDFVKSKQSGGGRSRSSGHGRGRDASGKQWC